MIRIVAIVTQLPCELKHAYGYENIPNNVDFHNWVINTGSSSPSGLTGPPNGQDGTTGKLNNINSSTYYTFNICDLLWRNIEDVAGDI